MRKSLKLLRENVRGFYKTIKDAYCPYFGEEVVFTSNGFNHLRYRGHRKERHFAAQKIRYKLFKLAPTIINNSGTLQEYDVQQIGHIGVRYFGFIAIMDGLKVKIIVRQFGSGKKHFWSIIPNWKTRRAGLGKTRINYTGDLASD